MFKGLKHVYNCNTASVDEVVTQLFSGGTAEISEAQFIEAITKLPDLEKAMVADMDPDFGRLNSYRTLEDQLAKLMGNIERLRRELLTNPTPEREEAIRDEIKSRKNQCKKMRMKGTIPSVGPAVFNQLDLNKDRFLSKNELTRAFKGLKHVYKAEQSQMDAALEKLFEKASDKGISEEQFVQGLKKLPELEAAMAADLDPDFGRLKSYRTFEDQLAKLMGNLERLRREMLTNPTPEREVEIKAEMRSRKDECKRFRANGVIPSVGPVVFNQLDLDKDRFVSQSETGRMFKGLKHVYDIDQDEMDRMIEKMFAECTDERGVTEQEFVVTLKKLPDLEGAMIKDMDPDWGRLRSYRTLEDQLAKLYRNIEVLEAAGDAS